MTSRLAGGLTLGLLLALGPPGGAQETKLSGARGWRRLSPPEEKGRVVQVHDVRDLVAALRDFPMRPFAVAADARREAAPEPGAGRQPVAGLLAALRRYLRRRGIADTRYTLSAHGLEARGRLSVEAAPDVQDAVRAFLTARRRLAGALVQVEARIYRLKDHTTRLPGALQGEPVGEEDTIYSLNAAQARVLAGELKVAANRKDGSVVAVNAPRLTAFPGQRAHVVVSRQVAYVADYHVVKVLGRKTTIVDPVVRTLEVGTGIEVKVELEPEDLDRARVEVFYQSAEYRRPLGEKQTAHGPVQVPKVDSVALRFTVSTRLPGHLLLVSQAHQGLGVDLVLLGLERLSLDEIRGQDRVRVKAIGPSPAGAKRKIVLFIDAGTDRGLTTGAAVRIRRTGEDGKPETVVEGTVTRAYPDLAELEARLPAGVERLDLVGSSGWWCEWGEPQKGARKRL